MDAATFLRTAELAEQAIERAGAAAVWSEPSALVGYTVGGLAGHLARAVLTVDRYLDQPVPAAEPTDAAGYVVRVLGAHDPVASTFHDQVRRRGEQEASQGPAALVDALRTDRLTLTDRKASLEPGTPIAVLEDTVLSVEDYLDTRLVELVVHLDDLGVSVGGDGAEDLPAAAYERVAAVLAVVAPRRVGPLATVRSLARRERHPEAVRAL